MRERYESAEKALAEAEEALVLPQSLLAGIDAEIALAQEKFSEWEPKVTAGDMDARINAQTNLAAYDEEITRLRQKRTQQHRR